VHTGVGQTGLHRGNVVVANLPPPSRGPNGNGLSRDLQNRVGNLRKVYSTELDKELQQAFPRGVAISNPVRYYKLAHEEKQEGDTGVMKRYLGVKGVIFPNLPISERHKLAEALQMDVNPLYMEWQSLHGPKSENFKTIAAAAAAAKDGSSAKAKSSPPMAPPRPHKNIWPDDLMGNLEMYFRPIIPANSTTLPREPESGPGGAAHGEFGPELALLHLPTSETPIEFNEYFCRDWRLLIKFVANLCELKSCPPRAKVLLSFSASRQSSSEAEKHR